MATVLPFKGIRPAPDKAHLVVTRSMEHYRNIVLKHKLDTNPFSFLHILQPDFKDGIKTKPGSTERLLKIKQRYQEFLQEEIFLSDQEPCFYLYQQIKGGHTFTGIIGCSSVEDYNNGIIKKHEHTIQDREEKLKDYLEVCDFNAEPVLFSYPNSPVIDDVLNQCMLNRPVLDFSTADRVRHKLWIISDSNKITAISTEFSKMNAIYIADGHHRSASSSRLAHSRKEKNPNHTGKENYNFYMGIFFPEDQLKIYDFNRVITDLNGLSIEEMLKKIAQYFTVINHKTHQYRPEHRHKFSMYVNGNWYELIAKPEICTNPDPSKKLDASILSDYILEPILGIDDLRTNKRVAFIAGIKGMDELKIQVDSGKYQVAFGLHPVSMTELKFIADNNGIMPPKTTYIEPKLRSGMVIYSLSDKP